MKDFALILLVGFAVVVSGCVDNSSNSDENVTDNDSEISADDSLPTDEASDEEASDNSDSVENKSTYTSDVEFRVDKIDPVSETRPNGFGFDTFAGENFTVGITVTNLGNESGKFKEVLVGKPDDITSDPDHFFRVSTDTVEPNETIEFNRSIKINHTEPYEILFPNYRSSPELRLDVGRRKLDYNQGLTFKDFNVRPGKIKYTDELQVEVNGTEAVENTTEHKKFVLVELKFSNSGNETVNLPGRNMISLESDRFFELENKEVKNYEIYTGSNLEPSESYSAYTLFKTQDKSSSPPELEYRHDSLRIGADWNITRQQWPEEMLKEQ